MDNKLSMFNRFLVFLLSIWCLSTLNLETAFKKKTEQHKFLVLLNEKRQLPTYIYIVHVHGYDRLASSIKSMTNSILIIRNAPEAKKSILTHPSEDSSCTCFECSPSLCPAEGDF